MNNKEAIEKLNELFPYIREYQKLASEACNIQDIFQDNGGKLLQMLLITGLTNLDESREGNDAIDKNGVEYELKSVNVKLTKSFSTNHHLNHKILSKYRKADWAFAVYEDIELKEIYVMTPEMLEPYFRKWEDVINEELEKDEKYKGINNPKIPLAFVSANGICIYKSGNDGEFRFADISERIEIRNDNPEALF